MGESEPISVIADSFNDFLIFLIESIENESLKLVDEREDWIKKIGIWLICIFKTTTNLTSIHNF